MEKELNHISNILNSLVGYDYEIFISCTSDIHIHFKKQKYKIYNSIIIEISDKKVFEDYDSYCVIYHEYIHTDLFQEYLFLKIEYIIIENIGIKKEDFEFEYKIKKLKNVL